MDFPIPATAATATATTSDVTITDAPLITADATISDAFHATNTSTKPRHSVDVLIDDVKNANNNDDDDSRNWSFEQKQQYVQNFNALPKEFLALKRENFEFKSGSVILLDNHLNALCTLVRKTVVADEPLPDFHNTWATSGGSVEDNDNGNVLIRMIKEMAQENFLTGPDSLFYGLRLLDPSRKATLLDWKLFMGEEIKAGQNLSTPITREFSGNYTAQNILKLIKSNKPEDKKKLEELKANEVMLKELKAAGNKAELDRLKKEQKLTPVFLAGIVFFHIPVIFTETPLIADYKQRVEASLKRAKALGKSIEEKNTGMAIVNIVKAFGDPSTYKKRFIESPSKPISAQVDGKVILDYYVDESRMNAPGDDVFLKNLKTGGVAHFPLYYLGNFFNNPALLFADPFAWKALDSIIVRD
jgi:hypothetical protein